MLLTILLRYRHPIILGVFPFLFFLLIDGAALAGSRRPVVGDEESRGTNVRWTTKGDVIVINYDLAGGADAKYKVQVIMKKENDPSFSIAPVTLEGNVGENVTAGTNREIRWYYRQDYPQGFQGEGYFFEIQVQELKGQSTWVYYMVGAAAVTGGVVALLLSRNQNSTPPQVELPMPPDRP